MSKTVKKAKRLSVFAKIPDIDSKYVLLSFSDAKRVLKTRPSEVYQQAAGQNYVVIGIGRETYVVPFIVLGDSQAKTLKALRGALAYRGLRSSLTRFA